MYKISITTVKIYENFEFEIDKNWFSLWNYKSTIKIKKMENETPQEGQINIELSEEVAEGIYSNLAIITHSNSEFILDFIRLVPNVPKAKVKSRIVLTPQHAKRLMMAMQDNVKKFEQQFGPIKEGDVNPGIPMNFGGPTAQA